MNEQEEKRFEIEKKAIMDWINRVVLPNNIKIENLNEDLKSGFVLCVLTENLSGKKIKKKTQVAKTQTQRVSNANSGFFFVF
jgi:hypothetical protein